MSDTRRRSAYVHSFKEKSLAGDETQYVMRLSLVLITSPGRTATSAWRAEKTSSSGLLRLLARIARAAAARHGWEEYPGQLLRAVHRVYAGCQSVPYRATAGCSSICGKHTTSNEQSQIKYELRGALYIMGAQVNCYQLRQRTSSPRSTIHRYIMQIRGGERVVP
jgi:hypothetical protein